MTKDQLASIIRRHCQFLPKSDPRRKNTHVDLGTEERIYYLRLVKLMYGVDDSLNAPCAAATIPETEIAIMDLLEAALAGVGSE